MVIGKLLVAMLDSEFVQPSHEPAGAIKRIELIVLAAVDVERLQPAKIIRLGFDRNDRVLPQPIRPAFLDDLAGVERHRQPNAEELRRVGIVDGRRRQRVDHLIEFSAPASVRRTGGMSADSTPRIAGMKVAAPQMSERRSVCVIVPFHRSSLPNTPRRPVPPHPKRCSIAGTISCSRKSSQAPVEAEFDVLIAA
jgi:hypothetical protein